VEVNRLDVADGWPFFNLVPPEHQIGTYKGTAWIINQSELAPYLQWGNQLIVIGNDSASDGDTVSYANVQRAVFIIGRNGPDTLIGSELNDVIDGGWGPDFISGHAGADVLAGGAGSDTVLGGPGDDIVFGGTENDTLAGGSGADKLIGG